MRGSYENLVIEAEMDEQHGGGSDDEHGGGGGGHDEEDVMEWDAARLRCMAQLQLWDKLLENTVGSLNLPGDDDADVTCVPALCNHNTLSLSVYTSRVSVCGSVSLSLSLRLVGGALCWYWRRGGILRSVSARVTARVVAFGDATPCQAITRVRC